MLKKLTELVYSVVYKVSKLFLFTQVVLTSYIVFSRYVLNKTPGWGETIVLFCMVWFSLLGAAMPVKDNSHLKMELLDIYASKKILKIRDRLNYVILFVFALFMIIVGIQLVELTSMGVLPGVKLKSSYLYASVPAAGLAILLMLIGKARELI